MSVRKNTENAFLKKVQRYEGRAMKLWKEMGQSSSYEFYLKCVEEKLVNDGQRNGKRAGQPSAKDVNVLAFCIMESERLKECITKFLAQKTFSFDERGTSMCNEVLRLKGGEYMALKELERLPSGKHTFEGIYAVLKRVREECGGKVYSTNPESVRRRKYREMAKQKESSSKKKTMKNGSSVKFHPGGAEWIVEKFEAEKLEDSMVADDLTGSEMGGSDMEEEMDVKVEDIEMEEEDEVQTPEITPKEEVDDYEPNMDPDNDNGNQYNEIHCGDGEDVKPPVSISQDFVIRKEQLTAYLSEHGQPENGAQCLEAMKMSPKEGDRIVLLMKESFVWEEPQCASLLLKAFETNVVSRVVLLPHKAGFLNGRTLIEGFRGIAHDNLLINPLRVGEDFNRKVFELVHEADPSGMDSLTPGNPASDSMEDIAPSIVAPFIVVRVE